MNSNAYITTSAGNQVHVRMSGEGEPLVMFHQWPRSTRMYQYLAPKLNHSHRLIMIDTPGCGLSEPSPDPSIRAFSKVALDVLNELHIGRTNVLGVHMGACMATDLAIMCPDLVGKAILFGYPLMSNDADRKSIRDMTDAAVSAWDTTPDGSYLMRRWARAIGDVNNARWIGQIPPNKRLTCEENSYLNRILLDIAHGQECAIEVIGAMLEYDSHGELPKLRSECLHLQADSSLEVPECQRGAAVAELVPQCTSETVPGTDGNLSEWRPDLFAKSVIQFLGS